MLINASVNISLVEFGCLQDVMVKLLADWKFNSFGITKYLTFVLSYLALLRGKPTCKSRCLGLGLLPLGCFVWRILLRFYSGWCKVNH